MYSRLELDASFLVQFHTMYAEFITESDIIQKIKVSPGKIAFNFSCKQEIEKNNVSFDIDVEFSSREVTIKSMHLELLKKTEGEVKETKKDYKWKKYSHEISFSSGEKITIIHHFTYSINRGMALKALENPNKELLVRLVTALVMDKVVTYASTHPKSKKEFPSPSSKLEDNTDIGELLKMFDVHPELTTLSSSVSREAHALAKKKPAKTKDWSPKFKYNQMQDEVPEADPDKKNRRTCTVS